MMELEQNGTNITETAQGNEHLQQKHTGNIFKFVFDQGKNYRLD